MEMFYYLAICIARFVPLFLKATESQFASCQTCLIESSGDSKHFEK